MIRRLPALRHEPFFVGAQLSRLMDELFRDFDDVSYDLAPSYGRTDIYEKNKALVLETELPGIQKQDIELKVEKDRLVISGEAKRSEETAKENYFRIGRRYGQFQRCFPLPANLVDKGGITARLEDGILRVTVPLKESIKEEAEPVEITIA